MTGNKTDGEPLKFFLIIFPVIFPPEPFLRPFGGATFKGSQLSDIKTRDCDTWSIWGPFFYIKAKKTPRRPTWIFLGILGCLFAEFFIPHGKKYHHFLWKVEFFHHKFFPNRTIIFTVNFSPSFCPDCIKWCDAMESNLTHFSFNAM